MVIETERQYTILSRGQRGRRVWLVWELYIVCNSEHGCGQTAQNERLEHDRE